MLEFLASKVVAHAKRLCGFHLVLKRLGNFGFSVEGTLIQAHGVPSVDVNILMKNMIQLGCIDVAVSLSMILIPIDMIFVVVINQW